MAQAVCALDDIVARGHSVVERRWQALNKLSGFAGSGLIAPRYPEGDDTVLS
jgi:hypothetical protein